MRTYDWDTEGQGVERERGDELDDEDNPVEMSVQDQSMVES